MPGFGDQPHRPWGDRCAVPSARGKIFADRYHSRVLRTPSEVRNAMAYIRDNHRHHFGSAAVVDEYSCDGLLATVVAVATHWLITNGVHRRPRGRPTHPTTS